MCTCVCWCAAQANMENWCSGLNLVSPQMKQTNPGHTGHLLFVTGPMFLNAALHYFSWSVARVGAREQNKRFGGSVEQERTGKQRNKCVKLGKKRVRERVRGDATCSPGCHVAPRAAEADGSHSSSPWQPEREGGNVSIIKRREDERAPLRFPLGALAHNAFIFHLGHQERLSPRGNLAQSSRCLHSAT